jgi:hypothetical protein
MPKRMMLVLGTVGLLVALAIPVIALAGHPAITNDVTRVATLTGAGETDPVDSNGSGLGRVTIDVKKRLLCYELIVTGINPLAAHIHPGVAGVNGPPVVDFSTFGEALGSSSHGCIEGLKRTLLRDIKDNPKQYYINVHTAAYPAGEIRGQLSK